MSDPQSEVVYAGDGFNYHYSAKPWREQPTAEECQSQAEWPTENGKLVAMWHHQWGGYCGRSLVRIQNPIPHDGMGGGMGDTCFSVQNWHDGEFPKDDVVTELHYCDASDAMRFFLKIIKQQYLAGHHDGETWEERREAVFEELRKATQ